MELLTAKDVQKLLKCSLPLIYKLVNQERLPAVKIPCFGNGEKKRYIIRFKKEDIFDFIEKHYETT